MSSASPTFQELVEAARKEGKVQLYSSAVPSSGQRIVDMFKTRYGIDAQVMRLASSPLAQRYGAEAQAGNVVADVVQISDITFFEQAASKGWLAQVDGLPSLAQWPKDAWNGRYAKAQIAPVAILYNTNVVSAADAPKGWQDVLKPVFKGQILLVDPRSAPITMNWAYLMSKTYGDDFLKQLAALQPRLVASAVPGAQQLAAGAAGLLVPALRSDAQELKRQSAPVRDFYPSPTIGNESYIGVSTRAPHPNAAKLLLDFILSPDGQSVFVQDGNASVLPNLPGADPLPSGYTNPDLKSSLADSAHLLDLLNIH